MSTFVTPVGKAISYPFQITTVAKCGRTSKVGNNQILWVQFVHKHPHYGVSAKFIAMKQVVPVAVAGRVMPFNEADLTHMLAQHKDPADTFDLTDAFEVRWVNERYIDWNSAKEFESVGSTSVQPKKATIEAIAAIVDPPKTGRGKWVSGNGSKLPAKVIRFYGVQGKTTDKAFLISVNGKSEWFPKSRVTIVGPMESEDGVVTFTAFDGEDWLVEQNFGEDMTRQFIEARKAIDKRLVLTPSEKRAEEESRNVE